MSSVNIYVVKVTGPESLNWYVKADNEQQAKARARREVAQVPGKWTIGDMAFVKVAYKEPDQCDSQS